MELDTSTMSIGKNVQSVGAIGIRTASATARTSGVRADIRRKWRDTVPIAVTIRRSIGLEMNGKDIVTIVQRTRRVTGRRRHVIAVQ